MKKYRFASYSLIIISLLLVSLQQINAQGAKSVSEKSYVQARRVLDAGIEALGGREAIGKIEDLSLKFSGINYARNQSLSPDTAYFRGTVEGAMTLDTKGNRVIFEQASTLPGFRFHNRQIIKGEKGLVFDMEAKTANTFTNPNAIANIGRSRFPHVMLMTASERAATLRFLGQEDFDGKKQNVIIFSTSDGTQWTLYFDAATNLLTKFENLDTDSRVGDVAQEFIIPGYMSVGGVKIPTGRIIKRGGEVIQDFKVSDVQINTRPAESAFERAQGFEDLPANNPTPTPIVVELAKDVYLVQDAANGYNVMFVAMNDYILVAEAPINEGTSRRAMAKIKETVPNKPIKYIVATHFHDDHSGGIRTYMAEGVTLVTTPGNKGYFEAVAKGVRTIAPDALALKPRPPVIEIVQNMKRVFTDDQHTVELYDIGAGPHTKEMLIVYLPKEKLVFQGDLLNLPQAGTTIITPGNETTVHFADRLKALGLNVEKIAAVHGRTGTMDDLRVAIEKFKALK
ncbi:MAG: MBL fold metallo-hydrolase [Acidobacteria bacterium]|nr:MBL fold metallo-hydrolase [Acidobacteriota bacterium]